jgi:hypothetical protein
MFKKKELTRLGDILVSKGLITQEQLARAIQEQSKRKLLLDPADANAKVTPIGEILIELGFIDRLQLKRGLNWQQRLRRASIAMALCAPFMIFSPSAAASTVRLAPITVEAESYSAMRGVAVETTKDIDGVKNVSHIAAGDWMNYENAELLVPKAGAYKISYRVANLNGPATMLLKNPVTGEVLDTVIIPKTGGWQTWITVEQVVTLPQGLTTLQLYAQAGGFNINWFKVENLEPEPEPLSAFIEAESYSSMSGVAQETTKDIDGGKNVSYIAAGDWMNYENAELIIPKTGTYKMSYRVANQNTNATMLLKNIVTGEVLDTIIIPKTGGWQIWTTVERVITLPKGPIKLQIYTQAGGYNFNWFKIETVQDTASSSSSTAAVSSSSSPAVVSSSSSSSPAAVSSSSSSKAAVSSSSMSSSSAASSAQPVAGPVGLSWTPPDKRENGVYLDVADLGGYEIRYKKTTDTKYTYISINDPWTNTYNFEWLEGSYVFQIAAFDKNGVYSPFVDIQRQ